MGHGFLVDTCRILSRFPVLVTRDMLCFLHIRVWARMDSPSFR